MRIERRPCTCRNCGGQQYFNIYNGQRPELDKACAACNSCGFKSVWYEDEFLAELKAKLVSL